MLMSHSCSSMTASAASALRLDGLELLAGELLRLGAEWFIQEEGKIAAEWPGSSFSGLGRHQ
jgi:hypothetical protein